jgi:DNA-directed RNA polymerase specialized sigma subunit, sigma24 homolog
MDKSLVTIQYKTADGKRICVEVSTAVRDLLEQTDRQIRSQGRKDRRYLDKREYIDGLTDTTIVCPDEDIADLVCRLDSYERLHEAIETLSEVQRRRIMLYYFDDLSYRQIAVPEGVSSASVAESIIGTVKKLKKQLAE